MTTFWMINALLLVLAALFVAIPLWRGVARNNAVVRDAANLEIYRDQIAELETDLKNGLLTQEQYEQGKRELQARMLDEVHPDARQAVSPRDPHKVLAIVLVVLIPLASAGLYLKVGNLQIFNQPAGHGGAATIEMLEARADKNPSDPEALLMLARSYAEASRFKEAAKVYDSLVKIVPDEAWIWADYADALAMTLQTLQGEPTKILERAYELDPNNLKTLELLGTAGMERQDYAATVKYWEKLLKMIPAENPDVQMIKEGVRQARQLLSKQKGGKAKLDAINAETGKSSAAGAERITGTVVLDASLKDKVSPGDTVFVLARAAQGPKMPLAILRKQVRDLPMSFSLDDNMAMTPEMKMSNFDQIVVVARISKSGNAMSQPGDLQGLSKPLKPGTQGVKLSIDQVVH
jgi:cytochrome c-type biogenesis protein CcmH